MHYETEEAAQQAIERCDLRKFVDSLGEQFDTPVSGVLFLKPKGLSFC